jgi:hypothetical protein
MGTTKLAMLGGLKPSGELEALEFNKNYIIKLITVAANSGVMGWNVCMNISVQRPCNGLTLSKESCQMSKRLYI